MSTAHDRSRQTVGTALAAAAVLASCATTELGPSIWPPDDFTIVVEEIAIEASRAQVKRRLRIDADGLVVYGTPTGALLDAATGVTLPLMDRLAVYRLVPTCTRGLARRIERLGIRDLGPQPGDRSSSRELGVAIRWQAFGMQRVITAYGRARGPVADLLALLAAHLPPGETFAMLDGRPIVPVLRGVPLPAQDPAAALSVFERLAAARPDDKELLLDGFALACAAGRREEAERWLDAWTAAVAAEPRDAGAFPDDPDPLGPELLARLLPGA